MTDFARSFTMTLDTLAIAEPCGMRPLGRPLPPLPRQALPTCRKCEQDQQHITTAATMHREMDMRFWLGQPAKEIGELA